jgi:hypothetical protein
VLGPHAQRVAELADEGAQHRGAHGKYDMTCSYVLATAYLGKLRAPLKGFYTFAESAPCPLFEEPAKLRRILAEDVLQGRNDQADSLP